MSGHPLIMGQFVILNGVLPTPCKEPVIKGHLSCTDMSAVILRCRFKTGFTVFPSIHVDEKCSVIFRQTKTHCRLFLAYCKTMYWYLVLVSSIGI